MRYIVSHRILYSVFSISLYVQLQSSRSIPFKKLTKFRVHRESRESVYSAFYSHSILSVYAHRDDEIGR